MKFIVSNMGSVFLICFAFFIILSKKTTFNCLFLIALIPFSIGINFLSISIFEIHQISPAIFIGITLLIIVVLFFKNKHLIAVIGLTNKNSIELVKFYLIKNNIEFIEEINNKETVLKIPNQNNDSISFTGSTYSPVINFSNLKDQYLYSSILKILKNESSYIQIIILGLFFILSSLIYISIL